MREGLAGFASVVAAAATPAAIFAALMYRTALLPAFVMAFIVAFAHALFLGLPAALFLVHKNAFRAVPMFVAGACAGLLPTALLLLSEPPIDGWIGLQLAASAAAFGATGGLAFYVTHRAVAPGNSQEKPKPPGGE